MRRTTRNFLLVALALLLVAAGLPLLVVLPDTVRGLLWGLAVGALGAAVLCRFLPDPGDAAPKALRHRYLREFLPPMAGYIVALWLSHALLERVEAGWLRAVVALLPVLAIAFAMRAVIRYIRDSDELQRQMELEAVSIATLMVSMLYMAGGFLQRAGVIDVPATAAMIWVFPLVCLVYGIAKAVVMKRYG